MATFCTQIPHFSGCTLHRKTAEMDNVFKGFSWLGNLDSNQDKQSQSLLCYRYTIPQSSN
jgi:hypothetical protein